MSCYGCGASFGAFKKEHGCKNCGFAFCTKCLPNKHAIPKLNNEKHKVCMKCYNILTGKVKPKEESGRYSPPENYKKRVAALEEREKHGHGQGTGGGNLTGGPQHQRSKGHQKKPGGISQADWDIQQRLEKLREKTPQEVAAGKVSDKEIDNRLANLKGMDPNRYTATAKPTYHPPDRRTQQEQMNDLLDEISSEVQLDARLPDPASEIAERLARLREKPSSLQDNPDNKEDPDKNNLNKASVKDSQSFSRNISIHAMDGEVKGEEKSTPGSAGEDSISSEEVSRILNETAQELEEDAKKALKGLEEDKEIMKKLQQVKQRRKESSTDVNKDEEIENSDSENEDDEDDDKKMEAMIIKQALEESKLDEAAAKDGVTVPEKVDKRQAKQQPKKSNLGARGASDMDDDDEWYDPDELPYCCICTEDATLRCFGCDRDLYCNACFREGHKELGLTDHTSIKYSPPKEKT